MKTTKQTTALFPLMTLMAGLALTASTARAQITLFTEDFESPDIYESGADPVPSLTDYSKTPAPAAWVRHSGVYASDRHGLADKATGCFTDVDVSNNQAYVFRYTASPGITTKAGEIGNLAIGASYTVTVEVQQDLADLNGTGGNGDWYDISFVAYDDGANRADSSGPTGGTVLVREVGQVATDGAFHTVTLTFTADPVIHASLIGKDLAIYISDVWDTGNSKTSGVIDNIAVTAIAAPDTLLWDTNNATAGAGNPTTGTWDGSASNWTTSLDGTATTTTWAVGSAIFSAGSDATTPYTVTVDGSQDISALLAFEEGTITLADGASGALNMTADSVVFVAPGLAATINVPFTDADDTQIFTKSGAGTLVINADNSAAAGGMLLAGGFTRFESPASINGAGETLTVKAGAVMAFGPAFVDTNIPAALDRIVTTSGGTIAVDNYDTTAFDFSVGTGADLTATYLGAIADTNYNGLFSPNGTTYRLGGAGGKLNLTNTSGMSEASPTFQVLGDVEISGNITAVTGTLTKQNSGTLILSGVNSYSANTTASGGILVLAGSNGASTQTTINAATVQLDSDSNGGLAGGSLSLSQNAAVLQAVNADRAISNEVLLNASPTISGSQSLTIGGTMTVNNNRTLTNSITGTGKVLTFSNITRDGSNNRNLTLSGDGDTTVDGTLVLGSGALTKNGSGTLTLNGTNTYTGTTTVNNDGTLLVNGDSTASTGNVNVNNTATLGGNGTIGGPVTITASANIAPGPSVGTLNMSSTLDISAMAGGAGKLNFDLNTSAASDKIAVAGTLSIGADVLGFADFNFTALGGLQNGTYKLITSGSPVSGTLDPTPANLTGAVGAGTGTLQISISGTDIELVVSGLGAASPYDTWANGAVFDQDDNGDGVSNGLAFLLGATDATADALGLLPSVTESGGGLVLSFNYLNAASRGGATLNIEHSSDLGISDAWLTAAVPEVDGTVSGVNFMITPGSRLNGAVATISSSEAAAGKLFGRLRAVNP